MFFTIVMIFVLFFLSIFAYSLLRKKQVIDAPPNLLATISFILLLYFSLCLVIAVPSVILCIVALGINYLFGDYITYDSFFSFISFSLLVSGIVVFLVAFSSFHRQRAGLFTQIPFMADFCFGVDQFLDRFTPLD